jgi:pyridoxamine 5'-phosphate oxidase
MCLESSAGGAARLDEIDDPEPFAPFGRWFAVAVASEELAEAMTLATVAEDGTPSARLVLLKEFDARGFVFYTNLESRKSTELKGNSRAALCFLWKSLRRQVRVEGAALPVAAAEADAYFASRPRDSQIGAWASDQSRPLDSREALERRVDRFTRRFGVAAVPRPPYWSGFRIVPRRIEFWQERPFRLHDRWVYIRDGEAWQRQRLFP